jgi:RNA polymerase sigma factor (sigma-70 family)
MSAAAQRREAVQALASSIYAEKRSHLLRIAQQNCSGIDDAEEALQEAFIAFIRKFDPDGEAPALAWLTLTLKRECWARAKSPHVKRSAGQERHDNDDEMGFVLDDFQDEGPSPQDAVELEERVALVRGAMAQLKPQERTVLSLLALGYSYKEIQENTGWTYTKVNRCSAEGRAALRELGLDIYKPH